MRLGSAFSCRREQRLTARHMRIPQPPDGLEPTSGGPSANSATYTKWTDYGILRGRTHPRVSFYFRDAFLDGDSRPAESLKKGDRESARY